jgi:hypothetical protein
MRRLPLLVLFLAGCAAAPPPAAAPTEGLLKLTVEIFGME